MDREKVIKALECRKNADKRCGNPCEESGMCYYATAVRDINGEIYRPFICDRERICEDAIALLKEQEEEIENLKQTAQSMMEGVCLLKEQEAELSFRNAKPITHTATKLDDATCPSCGNVVGEKQIWEGQKVFIQWKYCIFCGQKLDWEGR